MELIKFIQSFHNIFFNGLFQLITMMGEDYFFMAVAALVYWCINKNFGYKLSFAYLSNAVINTAIKNVFKIPRPFQRDDSILNIRPETATGYSFPSGHTQSAASFWTSFMLQIKKRWIYYIGTILIILVGFSRMYLGAHTPQDVAVGGVLGVCWVFVSNSMFDYADKTGRKSVFLLLIIPAVIGMFFFRDVDYYKASGTLTSFYIGYLIESRYIKYEVRAELWKQIIKYAAGMGVLLLIKSLLKPMLPAGILSDFIRYFIMGIWVTAAAPFIYKHTLSAKESSRPAVKA